MWARIEDGLAVELIDTDPAGKFHASIKWVKCNSDTAVGMKYDGVMFSPGPGPDKDQLAAEARARRDFLLRNVYDIGIIMLHRQERLGLDVSQKIVKMDSYASLLLDIPEQPGFPNTINWPDIPDA